MVGALSWPEVPVGEAGCGGPGWRLRVHRPLAMMPVLFGNQKARYCFSIFLSGRVAGGPPSILGVVVVFFPREPVVLDWFSSTLRAAILKKEQRRLLTRPTVSFLLCQFVCKGGS